MKRWRGWGMENDAVPVEVKSSLRNLLEMLVGSPTPLPEEFPSESENH